jgi:ubiquinone/menaquinone biosynthesis C-methylase UbiE
MSEGHSYGNGVSGFDQTFGLLMRQFVPTLIRIAKLTPGQRVLDIATGTGIAAEAALDAVGPSGHVTAADDTPLMLAEARHRLGASPNVSFAVERAGSLTFPDASFNAVLCSMALMIFPDRGHALAEFHRVLRRGGQLVVSINTRPERSLTGLVRMAVARHVPSMTAAMTHHYSLSDAARLRVLLETAKFQSVAVVMETRSFFFPSFDTYFEPFEQGGGPWGAQYVTLPAEKRHIVKQDVRQRLEGAAKADGSIEVGVDILFGSGKK